MGDIYKYVRLHVLSVDRFFDGGLLLNAKSSLVSPRAVVFLSVFSSIVAHSM